MNWSWWKNPYHFLPILLLASATSFISSWALEKRFPDLGFSAAYNLSLALFTASFAATIAMMTYSWVTVEGQRRQWRHDVEMRHFEQIYGPLYEEVLKVVDELRNHGFPWLQKWREIKEKSVGPFVDPKIAKDLDGLARRLGELSALHQLAYYRAENIIVEVSMSDPWGISTPVVDGIKSAFQGDRRFLYDPKQTSPSEHMMSQLRHTISDASALAEYVKKLKGTFTEDPQIQRRAALVESILPDAEALSARIRDRMMHPFG